MHHINVSAPLAQLQRFNHAPLDGALPRSSASSSSVSSAALVSVSNTESAIKSSYSSGGSPAEIEAEARAAQRSEQVISSIVFEAIPLMVHKVGFNSLGELEKLCNTRGYVMPDRYAECAEQLGLTTDGRLHDMTRSAMQAYFKRF